MLNWLTSNIGTIIVVLILAGIVFAAVFAIVKNKRKGKTTCGCGCSNCAMKDSCHSKKSTR